MKKLIIKSSLAKSITGIMNKARDGLVQKEVDVHARNGKIFKRKMWVRAGDPVGSGKKTEGTAELNLGKKYYAIRKEMKRVEGEIRKLETEGGHENELTKLKKEKKDLQFAALAEINKKGSKKKTKTKKNEYKGFDIKTKHLYDKRSGSYYYLATAYDSSGEAFYPQTGLYEDEAIRNVRILIDSRAEKDKKDEKKHFFFKWDGSYTTGTAEEAIKIYKEVDKDGGKIRTATTMMGLLYEEGKADTPEYEKWATAAREAVKESYERDHGFKVTPNNEWKNWSIGNADRQQKSNIDWNKVKELEAEGREKRNDKALVKYLKDCGVPKELVNQAFLWAFSSTGAPSDFAEGIRRYIEKYGASYGYGKGETSMSKAKTAILKSIGAL